MQTFYTGKRVVVTGGAGFIGSHIVEAFVAAGDDVVVLDALLPSVHGIGASTEAIDAPPGVVKIHGDVRDRSTVERALRGVDVVCHQAAMVGLGDSAHDAGPLRPVLAGDAARPAARRGAARTGAADGVVS